ncbi:hypothetical protein M758_7G053200 [Ceratodon purpureus]|nr:hypothetical protein M758_7G053200 [Ceratodon purpureus]
MLLMSSAGGLTRLGKMGSVGDESQGAVAEVVKELPAEPHLQEAEIREDAATEEPVVDKVEDTSVEVIEEPHVDKVEDVLVEVIGEPHVDKVEDGSVEVNRVIEEPQVDVVEGASVDAVTQKFSEVMGTGIDEKVDNGVRTTGEPEVMGNDAGVEEVVPAPKRKLPSVKRFSARRSAGIDDGNTMDYGSVTTGDAVPDSKAPSAIRKQRGAHRFSSRIGLGIDDRDTVDYGSVTTDTPPKPSPKPVETSAVAEEAVPTITPKKVLSVAEREQLRLLNIKRNKEIVCLERVRGKLVDITAGLELHTGVFSRVEQQKLVDLVRELQAKGRRNELKERTYSEPRKWMRGKGRVTLQFGCCYNYAVDKNGNPPGILRDDVVDPIPPLLRTTIKRLVRWHVLPPTCVPDSCIINMYEEGDCIPPHIDHHDFLRPFCTLSLLSECNIVFGANLEILGPGDFGGTLSLPLPVGSVLVLNGNGADVAKHAVPAVPTERISITFRKMDPAKVPRGFSIDKELQDLRPAALPSMQPDES